LQKPETKLDKKTDLFLQTGLRLLSIWNESYVMSNLCGKCINLKIGCTKIGSAKKA